MGAIMGALRTKKNPGPCGPGLEERTFDEGKEVR